MCTRGPEGRGHGSLRVRSQLQKELEAAAVKESRSVAQICEAFLRAGLSVHKEGTKYIHRFLSRPADED